MNIQAPSNRDLIERTSSNVAGITPDCSGMPGDLLPHDADNVARRIDEYRIQIMQANAEHGILPFFLATLSFTALFATLGHKATLYPWLSGVLVLLAVRLYLVSIYRKSDRSSDIQWVRWNVAILSGLGCLYGATPFLFPSNGEIWLLAVT
ncbi:MAG: hypothetical protein O3C28_18050, partial [Proteobacteria bacterium]|nr:hypothetical protein [Pseudomonadota bacterium]